MCILNKVLITATLIVLATASGHAATFTVTNTNDSGAGSLREAILAANANAGTDLIAFNIPGPGPHTIQPDSLPSITDPVVIDGYSQPGASPNSNPSELGTNAVLLIELDGSMASCCFGIALNTANSIVQGLVINRFPNKGLIVLGLGGGGNVIQGNFIGTDVTGTIALGNGGGGVELDTAGNTIGGTTIEARNLISGNRIRGIDLISSGNIIQGNLIGTDATGTVALGNTTASGGPPAFPGDGVGVDANSVGNTTIGGTTPGAGNIISGNGGSGIFVSAGVNVNVVEGNFIGTDVTGTAALGNDSDGIHFRAPGFPRPGPLIGGITAGAGNTIAFNGGAGISVTLQNFDSGAAILSNSIHSNAGLGIDLGDDGVTANDPGDTDSGPNNFQNFPVLTSATSGSTNIEGTLNSTVNTTFRLEFFSNTACDPSGNGEGESFLGSTDVTTDGSGNVSFMVTFAVTVPVGQFITATATDLCVANSNFVA